MTQTMWGKVICGIFAVLMWAVVNGATVPVSPPEPPGKDDTDKYNELVRLTRIMELLHNNYVDKDKVSYSRLVDGALNGMLSSLDPYSSYHSTKGMEQFIDLSEGKFVGIGVIVIYRNGRVEVESSIHDGPAWKAGIRAGDFILSIDGEEVKKLSYEQVMNKLKGESGSKVAIGYFDAANKQMKKAELVRENIDESPVPYEGVKVIDGSIGYIRIRQFSVDTADELDKAIARLKQHRLDGLIVDLRNNPGGLLVSAIQVCSRFIATGKMVARTAGRVKSEDVSYNAQDCDKEMALPLVILINGQSASASEVVAGCLKDHRRAVLIGTKSYGKGSVQKIVRLPDNSGVRYTTALYYTPSSRVINGRGIEPDIAVAMSPEENMRLVRQLIRSPGEIRPSYDGAVNDVQLQRAVEILKGINLISAGGE